MYDASKISEWLKAVKESPLGQRAKTAFAALVLLAVFYSTIRYLVGWVMLFCILAWFVSGIAALKEYVYRVGKALDAVCNAFLGGDPKETISSRIGKAYYLHHIYPQMVRRPPLWMWAVRQIADRGEKHHVFKAIELVPGRAFTEEWKKDAVALAEQRRL